MPALVLPVTPGTLPSGACPANYQDMLNLFTQFMSVAFPDTFNGITVSATKPADTTRAWLQLDPLGRPVRLYFFAQGAWLSLHTIVPGLTMWWFTALPNFTSFDGGDANPVGPLSGPMWQQALDLNGNVIAAQFPIAAGTLPSTKVLAVGDKGGEENHSLVVSELAPHVHTVSFANTVPALWAGGEAGAGKWTTGSSALNAGDEALINATVPFMKADSTGGTGTPPVVVPHNTMPPYIVGNLLQRTNRLYYLV